MLSLVWTPEKRDAPALGITHVVTTESSYLKNPKYMLLSLIRIPNKVGEGSMDTGCSKCPRGQNGAFGGPADQAGTAGADFSVEFIWNQKSPELTHTFCWISHHQFKLKSSQSPEHFNWLCFCAAEPGRARAARSLLLLSRRKMPMGSRRDGSFSWEGEAELCSDLFCGITRMIRGTSWPVHSLRVSSDLPLPFSGRIA